MKENTVITYNGFKFQSFPNKKPADYKRCRVLLANNIICYGFRFDTGFEREWEVNINGKNNIKFDEEIKGWWYM